ncbi:DAR GTPase 2, mitochondrial isoform X1 [Raphanus sativus]|uniref:DAR GTPase 2, mitochondrial isoform X1 n=1 Tax=Raphanus sativus TaxID=3726 RepID=A0A9W3CER5_RAPSA|nr:DAR GTPase 2, mitochondrial isoform X1 [Raphanus sativus]
MTTAKSWKIGREIGDAVVKASSNPNRRWYGPHMAASVRAISERIPLVDFVLEIRDARIPLSSEYELLRKFSLFPSKRIVVLNKMELADPLELKKWMAYFQGRNYLSYAVNSHNKECVKNFLNFLQSQVRELHKSGHSGHTTTMMLLGIPNVGKSALANSLHQIGRISAAEKGKLKHTTVSSQPGDTKDIMSLKIGSHPNVYVLDTPGVLPPKLLDAEICSKLALTGAIPDDIIGEKELARFCLTLLNSSHEYKKWAKLSKSQDVTGSLSNENSTSSAQRKRQYPTDHTQDFIVYDVRRVLYETISAFDGNLEDDISMGELIETQFAALRTVLRVTEEAKLVLVMCFKVWWTNREWNQLNRVDNMFSLYGVIIKMP